MTFEDFWKQNRDRYLKIAEIDIKLALNCAAEDAWGIAQSNTIITSAITTDDEQEKLKQPPFVRG